MRMPWLQPDDLKGVSETLLIPLHYRVEESLADVSTFKDPVAEAFHAAIAYEWDRFQGPSLVRLATVARTGILDQKVGIFLAGHPDGLVVNLGAGLDTRFHRLDNGQVGWIDIDLPDVIAFRRRLDEPMSPRHALFAGSVLDRGWIAEVKRRSSEHILLVAEGLFPYFTEEQHRSIFAHLADGFPGQELLFQTSAPSVIRSFIAQSDLTKLRTSAEVHWGFEESRDVEAIHPAVRFLREYPLLEACKDQLPEAIRQKLSSDQLRRAGKIVHVRFESTVSRAAQATSPGR
jgi:O-methyltransferase involved in polyketide biosynthesis